MTYGLYGYSELYNKYSNWVYVASFATKEDAENALSLRYCSASGRSIGGFRDYKIVEEIYDMP